MTFDEQAMRSDRGDGNARLRARMAELQWTAHNLELAPGVWTLPEAPDFLATDQRLQAILRLCQALYGRSLEGLRALDLGCLEGGCSVYLGRAGAEVLGVEARQDNVEKCSLARDALSLPGLTFVHADVKEATRDRFGAFDVVLALGILYHLDDPVGWLRQISGLTRGILFVDTHFAPEDADVAVVREGLRERLGPLESFESDGLEVSGRWFREWSTEAQRDTMPWASWSNPSSLWLTKDSLARAVRHAGFDVVVEQHDCWMDRHDVLNGESPRTMLVGLKPPDLAARTDRRF